MKKYLFVVVIIISSFLLANVSITKETSINDTIEVEVRGELSNPGIFKLYKNSILNDLYPKLNLNKDADISSYSLNQVLYNKQIIVIPKKSENVNKISINSATLKQLCLLPGIGESTAEKIIKYREENGSFNSLDELMNISGIGEKKYEKLLEYITL